MNQILTSRCGIFATGAHLIDISKDQFLIVEDSPSQRGALHEHLKVLGAQKVMLAEDAEAGLMQLAQLDQTPLIFLDLNLPGMNGQEMMVALGLTNFKGSIIVLSACEKRVIDTSVRVARANNVQLIGALQKPYAHSDLERLIKRWRMMQDVFFHEQHDQELSAKEVREAFAQDQIACYYQPQIDLSNGELKGLECFARIILPHHADAVLPFRFLPKMTALGFMDDLLFDVLEKALTQYKASSFNEANIRLSFNVSPEQLNHLNVFRKFDDIVKKHGVAPDKIVIEITEHAPIDSPEQWQCLNTLRLKGYHCSIDDFGTGYTNLLNLKDLPFDEVKIDRSLITDIQDDMFSQTVIESVMSLAKQVGANVVAEGASTQEELTYLSSYGHILSQGFVISRPKPMADIERWAQCWERVHAP